MRRYLFAILAGLALGIFLFTFAKRRTMDHLPTIKTKGLDEIGVSIEPAYPDKSWQALVLTNNSNRHLLAVVLRYEVSDSEGSTSAREVICEPGISLEFDAKRPASLLAKQSVIPPHSKWLTGLGIDRVQLTQGLPSFEHSLQAISLEANLNDKNPPTRIDITIDSVLLDDGRIIGPQKDNLRVLLTDIIKAKTIR